MLQEEEFFIMNANNLEHYLDLRRDDLDPELFGAALAVQHIYTLIANGGSAFSRTDWDSALHPHHLQAFLRNAVVSAQKTRRFEREWQALQRIFPQMSVAWEKGQDLFQKDLARATTNQEEIEYLSLIDFAVDCYAYVSAKNTDTDNSTMQAWAINGYMVAWRQHFLKDLETENAAGGNL
jgi:hypothetical protein